MLSVAKLAPGQERYYEASVARGLDDYYAGAGESPGVWVGEGAGTLGLAGVVAPGQLGALMRGLDPASGERLRRHPPVRTITVEQVDPQTGGRRLVERELRPVAGFDLVFSVPKSVSLLHALGDEPVRFEIGQAHLAAWHAALAYLEDAACVTRKGRNGVEREHAGGFVAAAFQHRTSRAQDPHLHTHVIVANAGRSPDGTWRALDGDLLLRTHRLAAGYLYHAHLRHELTERLGVRWGPVVSGMAELGGVPRTALELFSRRRAAIVEALARSGAASWHAAQVAAIQTRDRKEPVDLQRLRAEWEERAAEHGFGSREREALLGQARWKPPTPEEKRRIAIQLILPTGLTANRSTFSEADLITASAAALPSGAPVADVRQLARDFAALPAVVRVSESAGAGLPERYTTQELLRCEQRALRLATRACVDGPRADTDVAEWVVEERHPSLTGEQSDMARRIATAGDAVLCVVGPPGAGKTTALRAAADVLAESRIPVLGAAPSGIAAETLERDTDIPSSTLHRLLARADRDFGLPDGCVVVVDEAGMADTRTLARLLEHAAHAEARVVLVGDPRQLGAVGPGGLYSALVERLGAIELTGNQRQRDTVEQDALAHLRDGDAAHYLEWAAGQGRIVLADRPLDARASLLSDWLYQAQRDPAGASMIAYHRADVDTLNEAARQVLRQQRLLGPDLHVTRAGLGLARGDRIVCLRNEPALNVANGTRGTVLDVRHGQVLVAVGDRDYRRVPLGYADAGHVTHAYAVTGHKSQGQTLDHAFVLPPTRGQLAEWGYVALTRARHRTCLYLAETELTTESHGAPHHERETFDRLTTALAREANERLATDQLQPVRARECGPALEL